MGFAVIETGVTRARLPSNFNRKPDPSCKLEAVPVQAIQKRRTLGRASVLAGRLLAAGPGLSHGGDPHQLGRFAGSYEAQ